VDELAAVSVGVAAPEDVGEPGAGLRDCGDLWTWLILYAMRSTRARMVNKERRD
jgi:hypothetical protein